MIKVFSGEALKFSKGINSYLPLFKVKMPQDSCFGLCREYIFASSSNSSGISPFNRKLLCSRKTPKP